MSRENIIAIVPDPDGEGVVVTFQTHKGGEISYLYDEVDGAAIIAGADPKDFSGTRL